MKTKILLGLIVFLALTLRLYQLGGVPPSLYWDEASLGYNAFSIATTLHDEHGEFLPVTRFIAFGDYKPPGYVYFDALAIKLLGLSEFSTRLPSALAGALLVFVTYYLVLELLLVRPQYDFLKTNRELTALAAAFFVAISPWSLQMSRAAFEANLATLFSAAGTCLFLHAIRRRASIFYFLSSIFFTVSIYTFNSHRIFVPLMVGTLFLIFFHYLWHQKKGTTVFIVSLFLLLSPLFSYFQTREAQLRFNEVSWLADLAPLETSNQRISSDTDIIGKLLHNRRFVYLGEFLQHYTDHIKPSFLFLVGDVNPKLSIQTVGELYWLDLPLLLIGIYSLVKRRDKASLVIFSWALLAPVPAAFARETPHALRTLNLLPVPQIVCAVGLTAVIARFRKRYFLALFSILSSLFLFAYLHDYYQHYSQSYALDWEYGYKQMVAYTSSVKDKYDYVSVTNKYGRPYIYFLFYEQYAPENYWQTRSIDRDWFGFWTVHRFDKYYFDNFPAHGHGLVVQEPEGVDPKAKILKSIMAPNGQEVFKIYEKDT